MAPKTPAPAAGGGANLAQQQRMRRMGLKSDKAYAAARAMGQSWALL